MNTFTAIHDLPGLAAPGETFESEDRAMIKRLMGFGAIREATDNEEILFDALAEKAEKQPKATKAQMAKPATVAKAKANDAAKTETKAEGGDADLGGI